ncbi:hypothetical protein BGW42_003215 [Actinomortierella wolfii]|nr:hypothetical protein BGW42_003215 [Actinomortierella wolfii]
MTYCGYLASSELSGKNLCRSLLFSLFCGPTPTTQQDLSSLEPNNFPQAWHQIRNAGMIDIRSGKPLQHKKAPSYPFTFHLLPATGKVHGSLARAGKVKSQTPKVAKQEKKKKLTGRAKKREIYKRRFVNVTNAPGGKRRMNVNPESTKN